MKKWDGRRMVEDAPKAAPKRSSDFNLDIMDDLTVEIERQVKTLEAKAEDLSSQISTATRQSQNYAAEAARLVDLRLELLSQIGQLADRIALVKIKKVHLAAALEAVGELEESPEAPAADPVPQEDPPAAAEAPQSDPEPAQVPQDPAEASPEAPAGAPEASPADPEPVPTESPEAAPANPAPAPADPQPAPAEPAPEAGAPAPGPENPTQPQG